MSIVLSRRKKTALIIALSVLIGWQGLFNSSADAHGGKTHDGEEFSPLQALEKATELFNRLVSSGKLTEAWETGLKTVNINIRKVGKKREYVVQFEKSEASPLSVYFFFDQKGKYTGSNFTGK